MPISLFSQSQRRRKGLTLIEMLVAVTITLMVMASIVQLFSYLGDNLRNTRASLRVATDLRLIAGQLQTDLDGLTCPVRPSLAPESGQGCFEYIEGISRDYDWNADGILDALDSDTDETPDQATAYGDIDDVLVFTTRNTKTPFTGSAPHFVADPQNAASYNDANGNGIRDMGDIYFDTAGIEVSPIVEAIEAEVIWWTAIQDIDNDSIDSNGDGTPDQSDTVMLLRHARLIRPDLPPIVDINLETAISIMLSNDISVRIVPNASGSTFDVIPNSLGDLTQRENRFLHQTSALMGIADNARNLFPHHLVTRYAYPTAHPNASALAFSRTFLTDQNNVSPATLGKLGVRNASYSPLMSKSLVADALLAFDVRCFDPHAPVKETPTGGQMLALTPGETGYVEADRSASIPNANAPNFFRGAYVDLNFADGYVPIGTLASYGQLQKSAFSGIPHPTSGLLRSPSFDPTNPRIIEKAGDFSPRPAVYDTWSEKYERDGMDQDGDGLVDEGTNGIDDDVQLGVDDAGEKEAQPPYDRPLRGIEVRIRLMDYETRNIRQVSVVTDFVPE